jgi:hypothetical protein
MLVGMTNYIYSFYRTPSLQVIGCFQNFTLLQKGFSQDDRVGYMGPHIFICYEK